MVRRLALALALVALVATTPRSAAADWCFSYCSVWSGTSNSYLSDYLAQLGDHQFDFSQLQRFDWNFGDFDLSSWKQTDWSSYLTQFQPQQPRDGYSVSEPGTLFLLATGLIGLGYVAWLRREDEFLIEEEI